MLGKSVLSKCFLLLPDMCVHLYVCVPSLGIVHCKQAMIRSGTLSILKKAPHRGWKGRLSGGRGRLAAADEVDSGDATRASAANQYLNSPLCKSQDTQLPQACWETREREEEGPSPLNILLSLSFSLHLFPRSWIETFG